MTKNPYQIRIPPHVYRQAKAEQDALLARGIKKPLWAIVAEKTPEKWNPLGGFRL